MTAWSPGVMARGTFLIFARDFGIERIFAWDLGAPGCEHRVEALVVKALPTLHTKDELSHRARPATKQAEIGDRKLCWRGHHSHAAHVVVVVVVRTDAAIVWRGTYVVLHATDYRIASRAPVANISVNLFDGFLVHANALPVKPLLTGFTLDKVIVTSCELVADANVVLGIGDGRLRPYLLESPLDGDAVCATRALEISPQRPLLVRPRLPEPFRAAALALRA